MSALPPPSDVPAARLFRLLLGRPRPVLPLSLRLPFAPDVALSVRGLTALEDAEVVDVDPDLPPEILRGTITRRLIAATLLADGQPALASAEDVSALTEPEADALSAAVLRAVCIVSPMRRVVDTKAWHARLVEGAKCAANLSAASSLFLSTQTLILPSKAIHEPAPDRYFGLPLADLTDGQLMAYSAACAVFEK